MLSIVGVAFWVPGERKWGRDTFGLSGLHSLLFMVKLLLAISEQRWLPGILLLPTFPNPHAWCEVLISLNQVPGTRHCWPSFYMEQCAWCNNLSFILEGTPWHSSDHWRPKIFTDVVDSWIFIGFISHPPECMWLSQACNTLATSCPSDLISVILLV